MNLQTRVHQNRLLSFIFILAALQLLLLRVADAATIEEARAAYIAGQFTEAAQMAEAVGTSDGYALASKSLTIYGRFIAGGDEKRLLFEQAIELANRAIQADSNNAGAYLELVRAIGQHSNHISKVTALKENYAKKSREGIENAIRIDPEFAAAYVSLGRWHVGIIARIGSFAARVTYGAKKKVAIESFDRAIELNIEDKAGYFEIAVGYQELSYKKYKEEVHDLLKRAIEMPSKDAHDSIIHEETLKFLGSLEASSG